MCRAESRVHQSSYGLGYISFFWRLYGKHAYFIKNVKRNHFMPLQSNSKEIRSTHHWKISVIKFFSSKRNQKLFYFRYQTLCHTWLFSYYSTKHPWIYIITKIHHQLSSVITLSLVLRKKDKYFSYTSEASSPGSQTNIPSSIRFF